MKQKKRIKKTKVKTGNGMSVTQLWVVCVLTIRQLMVYTGFSNASVPSACHSLATCLPLNIWKSAPFERANQHFWKTRRQTQAHTKHTHTDSQHFIRTEMHIHTLTSMAHTMPCMRTHTHTQPLKVTLPWLEMPFMQIEYKPSADQNLALNLICN